MKAASFIHRASQARSSVRRGRSKDVEVAPAQATHIPLAKLTTDKPQSLSPQMQFRNSRLDEAEAPSLEILYESMKSMHVEVSQMSRSLRSMINSELEGSMKALPAEINRLLISSIRLAIRTEMEEFFTRLVIEPVPDVEPCSSARSLPATPIANCRSDRQERPQVRFTNERLCIGKVASPSGHTEEKKRQQVSTSLIQRDGQSALEEPLLARSAPREKAMSSDSPRQSNEQQDANADSLMSSYSTNFLRWRPYKRIGDNLAERAIIKRKLKEALDESEYNVEELYCHTGLWQKLARHNSWLSLVTTIVVGANVLWIGVDEDLNHAVVLCNAPPLSQVVNNLFCMYFTMDMVVRFLAFQNKMDAFRDHIFLFDMLLVLFMVWETWIEVALYLTLDFNSSDSSAEKPTQIFRFFRLFRLTRMPRVIRMARSVPELMILIRGMAAAMRSVIVIMLFIGMTIFVFGILFADLLRHDETFGDSFANVPQAMHTLFLQVLCGPDSDFMNRLLRLNWAYYVLWLIFILVALLTWMNMMIGVLCDVVAGVSEEETDAAHLLQLEHEIGNLASEIDKDGNGMISRLEFHDLLMRKDALTTLYNVGVDVVALGGLTNFIFAGEDEMTMNELIHLITEFRGSRHASVKDLVDTRRFMTMEFDGLMAEFEQVLNDSFRRAGFF